MVLKLASEASSVGTPVSPHRAAPKIPFSDVDHSSGALFTPNKSLENKAR